MKLQYLRAFIVLLAGLITLIVNMKNEKPVTLSLLIVLIVILIFYVIGTLIIEILQKSLEDKNQGASESESNTEEETDELTEIEDNVAFSFDEDEME